MKNESIIYPIVAADKWAKKYSIFVESHPCEKCGKILFPTIPFATGRWRGLISEPHGCGEEYNLSISTKATAVERQELMSYFHVLHDNLNDPQLH